MAAKPPSDDQKPPARRPAKQNNSAKQNGPESNPVAAGPAERQSSPHIKSAPLRSNDAGNTLAYRLGGAAVALLSVLLLFGALLALRGNGDDEDDSPQAASASNTASEEASRSSSAPSASESPSASASPTSASPTASPSSEAAPAPPSADPPPAPSSAAPPPAQVPAPPPAVNPEPAVVRLPVTVLNNSTVNNLGERAANELRSGGWQVPHVGNFQGTIPATTLYFSPGNREEERAAHALADQFPQVQRVMERYQGLPDSARGLVLVVTKYWVQ